MPVKDRRELARGCPRHAAARPPCCASKACWGCQAAERQTVKGFFDQMSWRQQAWAQPVRMHFHLRQYVCHRLLYIFLLELMRQGDNSVGL